MTIPPTRTSDTSASAAALERRRAAAREGIASATIEGGDVGDEARAIMADWAEGRINQSTMEQRVLALDEP